MTTKALVASATKHGSTTEIATAIADTLRASGTRGERLGSWDRRRAQERLRHATSSCHSRRDRGGA